MFRQSTRNIQLNHKVKIKIMAYKEINAQVADADVQAIKAALAVVQTKLPFLIGLSGEERKSLHKLGQERLAFVEGALQGALNNPTILPASFDKNSFQMAVTLFAVLTDLNTATAQLASKLDDTRMSVGTQALSNASDVYHYIQTAAVKIPGLRPLAAQLGQLNQKAVATRRANNKIKAAAAAAPQTPPAAAKTTP
jgi:hypothetical protein